MSAPKPLEQRHGHSLLLVRLIAIGKLFKSAGLLIVGVFIIHMLYAGQTAPEALHIFVNALRLDEHNHFIHGVLEKSLGISSGTLHVLSVGTIIYSVLYFIEGMGLLFDQGWAEWMVIITTAGFIPLEIYEIREHPTILRVIVFLLNLLILVYIAMRLRWRHLAKLEARHRGTPLVIPHETLRSGIKP